MKIVQFTRFQVQSDQEAPMLAAQMASTDACRAQHRDLRDVLLIRLDSGDWLDVAVWASNETGSPAVQADKTGPPESARDDFFGQVEGLVGQERGVIVACSPGAPHEKHQPQPERSEEIPQ
jgi:hypothetical protein